MIEPIRFNLLVGWTMMVAGAVSGAGIAFLDAQITDLENKCSAERSRIGQERAAKQKTPAHCEDLRVKR